MLSNGSQVGMNRSARGKSVEHFDRFDGLHKNIPILV